ncbi:MAG: hypothetical protein J4F39_17460 [Candidatus Latescibacteria bacterium]|nr:hypothetical protein [Candidatus Latescibacterota bacterium]
MKPGIKLMALVCGLLLPVGAWAVDQSDTPRLSTSRGHLQISWNSDGTMGGWNLGSGQTGEPDMFWYPGWANIPSSNASSNYTRRGGNAVGFGTWIMVVGPGGVDAAWTGPRGKSVDITPLVYDPSSGPEAELGAATEWEQGRSGSFSPASNYWPGANVPDENDVSAPPRLIRNYSPGEYTPYDAFAEEILVAKWTNKFDITITRKVHNWSHQMFDDFVIAEFILENTGSDRHNEVYLPLLATWKSNETSDNNQGGGRWWRWLDDGLDDHFRYTEAGNYVDGGPGGPVAISAARAQGLKLSYQFDGDSPFKAWEDTGDPWIKDIETSDLKEMAFPDGKLAAHAFVGMAPVAFADSPDDPRHAFNMHDVGQYVQPAGDQPVYQGWWNVRTTADYDEPVLEGETPAEAFAKLTAATAQDNPTEVGGFTNAQVYGPWALGPGDKAKVVVAFVAGSGAEYAGPGKSPIDIWQWSLTADKASYLSGEQAIVEHLEHALFAYQSGFDIPDSPPDIDVYVKSDENAKVKLFWAAEAQGAIHPDYDAADVAGFRIYRGLRGTLTATGPFSLVGDVPVGGPLPAGVTYDAGADWPVAAAEGNESQAVGLANQASDGRRADRPGMYGWSDASSNAGFFYYYSIRAYQKPHDDWVNNDGTMTFADLPPRVQKFLQNGQEGPFSNFLQVNRGSPVLPFVAAADALERDIVVVPNPYMANGTNEYGGGLKVRFVNVPSNSFIYIFNTAGQLIQVLRQKGISSSETSWTGRPYSTIRALVGPGIYFYAVHGVEGSAGAGKIKTGTFVVIR